MHVALGVFVAVELTDRNRQGEAGRWSAAADIAAAPGRVTALAGHRGG